VWFFKLINCNIIVATVCNVLSHYRPNVVVSLWVWLIQANFGGSYNLQN